MFSTPTTETFSDAETYDLILWSDDTMLMVSVCDIATVWCILMGLCFVEVKIEQGDLFNTYA